MERCLQRRKHCPQVHDGRAPESQSPHLVFASGTNNATMAEPTAPRNARPRSPALEGAHEVMRALGLGKCGGGPPADDSDEEEILAPTNNAPTGLNPLAGSVQALCPPWRRGHFHGEGWCRWQHSKPTAEDGAISTTGHIAARVALHYGVAQGWIEDHTARGSANIQEYVDRVAYTGQTEVALHTRGHQGKQTEGLSVEPNGTVLVLAAEMVCGVLHPSPARRARPVWTIRI